MAKMILLKKECTCISITLNYLNINNYVLCTVNREFNASTKGIDQISLCNTRFFFLDLYHATATFDALEDKKTFENIVGKGENAFSPFAHNVFYPMKSFVLVTFNLFYAMLSIWIRLSSLKDFKMDEMLKFLYAENSSFGKG